MRRVRVLVDAGGGAFLRLVPSLAYRVESAGAIVVFGSDQTGTNPRFVDFARNADVVVMHFTIGGGAASPLHAAPEVVAVRFLLPRPQLLLPNDQRSSAQSSAMEGRMNGRFRTTLLAITIAAFAAAGLHAQAGQPADTQKPAPKPHDMTGCLAKGDTATTYRLTDVEGGKVKTVEITDAPASLKLDGHVGHKVTITGVGVPAPKDKAAGHYMKIDAMKHVAPKCP